MGHKYFWKNTSKRAYNLQNMEKAFNAGKRVQGKTSSPSASASNAISTVADLFAAVKRIVYSWVKVYSVGKSQVQNSMKEAFDKVQREKEGKRKNSREMDTVKALERQNALMKERWEYWKGQAQTTKTAKADKTEVRKLARDILRGYSSDTKVEDILPDLQRLANQNDSYSDMVDAAEGIARKILEGSGVDVNADLAQTRERLKKYLRIKWMQAGKL